MVWARQRIFGFVAPHNRETIRMMNVPFSGNRFGNLKPNQPPASAAAPLKQLSLSEFLKPLAIALKQKQPWVEDFGCDQISLPPDLYEVIKTFSGMQPDSRPSS